MSSGADSGLLEVDGLALFEGAGAELSLEPAAHGAFLSARLPSPEYRRRVTIGRARGLSRFVACYRYEPFWMKPRPGRELAHVPADTQCLWLELASGKVALVAALIDAPFRSSLEGREGALAALLDTGDVYTRGESALVAYLAVGDDPYRLAREGAEAVVERLGRGKLRRDKPLPPFADDFGWCTWDAFYQEVSHEKLRQGLTSFRAGGVSPKVVILDDGWQSVRTMPTGERRLTSFAANEKFPGDLAITVRLAKEEFGARHFLVWHAVQGYWGGVDGEALDRYGVDTAQRFYSPEILSHAPALNWDWWGPCAGRLAPESLARFYDDYHAHLRAQGVDGVKVDNQSSVECLAFGQGGRVEYMRRHATALEASARRHFDGSLINCMSMSNDRIYHAADSTLMRTSTDFWPDIPSSHGLHVYTNALNGLWFGQFVHPDWDMFQSGHQAGPFHAAARAVSGSPVYVSDKPGVHDFNLLRQLVLSDGSVLRASDIGLPTRDSLFADPLEEAVLFKVWNQNEGSHVIGVFNARHHEGENVIAGSVGPSDVPDLAAGEFALYLSRRDELFRVARDERVPLALDTLGAEVATLVPIDRGVAPLGLVDKLNGAAAVRSKGWQGDRYRVELRDGGSFACYAERRPLSVTRDDAAVEFRYEGQRLTVEIARPGPCALTLRFT